MRDRLPVSGFTLEIQMRFPDCRTERTAPCIWEETFTLSFGSSVQVPEKSSGGFGSGVGRVFGPVPSRASAARVAAAARRRRGTRANREVDTTFTPQ